MFATRILFKNFGISTALWIVPTNYKRKANVGMNGWCNTNGYTQMKSTVKTTTKKTAINPFRTGTGTAHVFALAANGTTRDAIKTYCSDAGNNLIYNAPRMFHCLQLESYLGVTWTYTENDGAIKLTSIARVPAKKQSAPSATVSKKRAA